MNNNINDYDRDRNSTDEIELKEIFYILWNKKLLISLITGFIAISAVIYSLMLPNIYLSSALLAPESNGSSSMGSLSKYSSMASLAGISIPSVPNGDKSIEAIERIKSFQFFSSFILPVISLENLLAVKKWDPNDNKIYYKNSLFLNGKWVNEIPSNQMAYEKYVKILNISQDTKTGFVFLSIEHMSPNIAKIWVDKIISEINKSMRDEEKLKAIKSIDFLNKQMEVINYKEIREAVSSLQQEQMQSLMMVESNEDYVFKVLNAPISPEEKYKPSRSIICIVAAILGFVLSSLYVLISFYARNDRLG